MKQNNCFFKKILTILLASSSLFFTAQPAVLVPRAPKETPTVPAMQEWLAQPRKFTSIGFLALATKHHLFMLDQHIKLYKTIASNLRKRKQIRFVSVNLKSFEHYSDTHTNKYSVPKMNDNQRAAAFKSFLKHTQPDICCLQEFDTTQKTGWAHRFTVDELNDYSIIHNTNDNLAIFFNPTKIQFVRATHSTGPDGAHLQAVLFEDLETEQKFVVMNNDAHFDKMNTHQKTYRNIIAASGSLPIIATGGWNSGLGIPSEQKNVGNHNICFLQELFASKNGWRDATAHIPYTARHPKWSNVFSKVDGIFTRDIKHVVGVDSIPEQRKGHLLISVAGHKQYDQIANHEIVNEHKPFMHQPGNPGIVYSSMGQFDANDPNGHFSDHTALFMVFSFKEPSLPMLLPQKETTTKWIADQQRQLYLVETKQGQPVAPAYINRQTGVIERVSTIPDPTLYFYIQDLHNKSWFFRRDNNEVIPILRKSTPHSDAYVWDPTQEKYRRLNKTEMLTTHSEEASKN